MLPTACDGSETAGTSVNGSSAAATASAATSATAATTAETDPEQAAPAEGEVLVAFRGRPVEDGSETGASAAAPPSKGEVIAEVANSPPERRQGLMFREDLATDRGMLFVFARSDDHAFWMQNTPLPLDMIFIGDDRRVVGVVAGATPFSTETRQVGAPSRYVLEVNAGWAAAHDISVGDAVMFDPEPPAATDAS